MNQKVSFKLNYQNVLFLILLFVTSFAIFMLRNLDPITYPTLYAEDALWTEKLLSKGFIDTAFNTRSFPILGFVIFYQLGLLIVNIFAQGNIFYLPLAYFILSNIFFALIIVSL
ncbi:hypothetical protein V2A85_24555, partial [Yersinia sp. 1252 StPb PI]|uniref:hypothetical protein n=1 Tax=Yersinia sp. 1252 StPb PI TaxID=3117404 RepID=UPI003B280321